MLKSFWMVLALIAVGSFGPMPVMAEVTDCPQPMEPTVQSLQDCVRHAADMGLIDNAGVAKSLLAKLHTAQIVQEHDDPTTYWTTINVLGAFVGEVQAQAGKHIDAAHAYHMEMHAQMIIAALRASSSRRPSSSG